VTAETGLTISQADVRLSKNGGAFAQKNDSNAATHMENGYYSCALSTTDTGTPGILVVAVNESGALPVWARFVVVPANVYDALVAGSDTLQVHANEITAGLITAAAIASDAITSAKIADGAITAAKIATGAIDADAIAADAVSEIQSGLATAAALDAVDNFVDTEVAAIKAVTDKLDSALELDGAVYRYTSNALEQGPGGGGGGGDPWATSLPGSYTSGQAGWIVGNRLDAAVSSVSGNNPGAGAVEFVYTLTEAGSGDPIADADVWVSTDAAGSNVVASGTTDQNGEIVFYLDSGTVYIWRQKSGYNFSNPDTEVIV
jgi:hypothetical protein